MLVQNGGNQQSQTIPDQRDNVISWLRSEFAAANAIIDALCQHVRIVGEPSEYDLVLTSIQQRRYNWTAVLYMQQYVSIAEVMFALQQVAGRKKQRNSDHFSSAKINCEFNEKDNASSGTEIHGGTNHRSASEGSISHPTESVKKLGHQISFSQKGTKDWGNSSGQSYADKREIIGTNSALHPAEDHGNPLASGTSEYERNASSSLSSALSGKLKQGDGVNWVTEEYPGSYNSRLNGAKEHEDVEEDSIQKVPGEAVGNSVVTEAIGQGRHCMHGNRQKSEPELTEFEQILKKMTFSREEFNHLAELLQSRIVDNSSDLKDYEERKKGLHGGVEPNNGANANDQKWPDEREKTRQEKENVVWDNSLLSNTASLAMPPSAYNQSLGHGVYAADQNYNSNGRAPLFSSVAISVEMPLSSVIGDKPLQSSDSVFVRMDANSAVLDVPSSASEKSKGFRMSALEISESSSDEEDHGDGKSPVSVHDETGKFTSIQSDRSNGGVDSLRADNLIQTLFGGKDSAGTKLSTRTEFSGSQSTSALPSNTLEFSGGGFSLCRGEKSGREFSGGGFSLCRGEKSGRKFINAKRDKSRRKNVCLQ